MPEVSRNRFSVRSAESEAPVPDFFSVSEFNTLVHDVIASGFPRAVWVCGEVQEYERNKDKKHAFFTLVEKDPETHEIKAKIGAVIWAFTRPKIEAILKRAENAFELKDDIEVKFLCKVDFYPPHGTLRLVVESIDPVHTLGKVAQERQKLIAELTQSGVLERNKALALPDVPLMIGLITAPDSAAYHDFCDELKKSGYAFKVFFVHALMQGKGCPESVLTAMKKLHKLERLDVIVITRGGGSIAELSCFDSKIIAQAIGVSRYPVVTGIGHEINTTVTDLAAHSFSKTPTAIAQFLAGRVTLFLDNIVQKYIDVISVANDVVRERQEKVRHAAMSLQAGTTQRLKDERSRHIRCAEFFRKTPRQHLERSRKEAAEKVDLLKKTIRLRIDRGVTKIGHCQKLIDMASPKNILKRGFSVTRLKGGKILKDVKGVNLKDILVTELATGEIESLVQNVEREDRRG
ncbi:MAG: exodeoxyribonuclease VII large subunit [Candidatus Omnitrophica bacterium]|nr:exodeoxyribonuclease VII large subunit [Candidatus Omnitrophota bacterium]